MNTKLQNTIAYNLYRIRTEVKMTREELAEKAGISVTFYANIESGNRMMSIPTLYKLADALGVTTDSLLYEESYDEHIKNIEALLQSQPKDVVSLAEKMIRLMVMELSPKNTDTDIQEIAQRHECGV